MTGLITLVLQYLYSLSLKQNCTGLVYELYAISCTSVRFTIVIKIFIHEKIAAFFSITDMFF